MVKMSEMKIDDIYDKDEEMWRWGDDTNDRDFEIMVWWAGEGMIFWKDEVLRKELTR